MKLIAADIILLIVGLILLGGATAGLVATNGNNALSNTGSSSGLFNVTYSTSSIGIGSPQNVASFTGGSVDFTISQGNISKVTVTVTCTATGSMAAAYTVNIQVAGPHALTGSKNAIACAGSPTDITIDVAAVPKGGSVPGSTKEDAQKHLGPDANATKATGGWKVSYQGSRGSVPVVGGQLPAGTGSIAMKADQWKPTFVATAK
jgi:hypothetical protein